MRPCHIAVVSLLAATAAEAKPLPSGMKVALQKGRPMVTVSGATVPLANDTIADWDAISAELSDDGASITASGKRCRGKLNGDETKTTVPLAVVQARAENQAGVALAAKGKHADAETRFSAAIALDENTPEYGTNLLVAQVKAGKLDAADRTLASAGKRAKGYFAWRLVVDPALKSLAGRPSTTPFSTAPGKVRAVTLHVAVAYSKLGMVASRTNSGVGGSNEANPLEVSVTDISNGKEAFRIPIKNKAQIAAADALLQRLGFEYQGVLLDVQSGRSTASNDGRAFLLGGGGPPRLQFNGKTEPVTIPDIAFVGFVEGAAVLVSEHTHVVRCDDKTFRTVLYTIKTQ